MKRRGFLKSLLAVSVIPAGLFFLTKSSKTRIYHYDSMIKFHDSGITIGTADSGRRERRCIYHYRTREGGMVYTPDKMTPEEVEFFYKNPGWGLKMNKKEIRNDRN